jgi:hypothetical protein
MIALCCYRNEAAARHHGETLISTTNVPLFQAPKRIDERTM